MLAQAFAATLTLAAVTFPAPDGRKTTAEFAAAAGEGMAPAAVLVPPPGSARDSSWEKLAAVLNEAGIATLTLHPRPLAATDAFGVGALDVTGAIGWLRAREGVDATKLLVVGGGEGAMVALAGACVDVEVAGLAMLSPSLDAERLDDATALGDWGRRPLFIAIARGDKTGARSALVIDGNAKGPKELVIAEGSRQGAALVMADEKARAALVRWARIAGAIEKSPVGGPR